MSSAEPTWTSGAACVIPRRVVDVDYTRSGKRATYRIAGPGSGARPGTVSPGSPVGQGLIGRGRGDRVSVELPDGRAEELRIVAVLRDEASSAAGALHQASAAASDRPRAAIHGLR